MPSRSLLPILVMLAVSTGCSDSVDITSEGSTGDEPDANPSTTGEGASSGESAETGLPTSGDESSGSTSTTGDETSTGTTGGEQGRGFDLVFQRDVGTDRHPVGGTQSWRALR